MRHERSFREKIVTIFALWAATSASAALAQDIQFDPSYARNPPAIATADFEMLAKAVTAGNAILRVRFADQRRATRVAIQGGPGPTYLRDDGAYPDDKSGDGSYAAVVNINTQAYLNEQRRRIELAKRFETLPVFRMRELLRYEPFRPSALPQLTPGRRNPLDRFRGIPFNVYPWKALMITELPVVEDPARTFDACTGTGTPMGAWTFGKLMTEIANEPVTGIRPGDFVEHWLQEWTANQTINTFTVPSRQARTQLLIDAWPRLPDGQLDLAQAPFRLLAIVNRLDLRGNTLYGSTNGGEARFVFGMLDCNHVLGLHDELEMLTILEYGVKKNSCPDARTWAQQWLALSGLAMGSAAYNAQLQAITDQFTLANANPAQLPNHSAISQVRTNEFSLGGPAETFWELRESRLNGCRGIGCPSPTIGLLEHKTVAQTPDRSFAMPANWPVVRAFINANEASILSGTHVVPALLPSGTRFLGGHIEPGAGFAWNPGSVDLEARHEFAKATCNGCHTVETSTHFTHISTRAAGETVELSDFLTGADMPKTDPVSGVSRTFHELLDRQQKLDATANMSCLKKADFPLEEIFHEFMPPGFAH